MKILFISHEGTRTGAPFVLLHFINWLKAIGNGFTFDTLVLSDGDLVQEFRKSSEKVFLKHDCYPSFYQRIRSRINGVDYKAINENREAKSYHKGNYDLIYANSVASLDMAIRLKKGIKYSCYFTST